MFFKKRMQWLSVLLLLLPLTAYNQFNIKIGYSGGYTKAPEMNDIVSRYNLDFESKYGGKLDDPLDEIKMLHGLEIGARYRMGSVGFELTWNSLSDRSDAYGALASGTRIQSKWFTSLTEYSLGIENYIGNFGYGAAFGYRTLRIKSAIEGTQRKKSSIVSTSGMTSKFYLLFQIPGEVVALAFKPYVEIPLKASDITNFEQSLFYRVDETYKPSQPTLERYMMFGLSIVLYNGPQ
ncbi:MAG: hypothetical protein LC107_01785 [Chitinophagales bacterium]|nr:hypothetical protein [Chitinophagales bacterium]